MFFAPSVFVTKSSAISNQLINLPRIGLKFSNKKLQCLMALILRAGLLHLQLPPLG